MSVKKSNNGTFCHEYVKTICYDVKTFAYTQNAVLVNKEELRYTLGELVKVEKNCKMKTNIEKTKLIKISRKKKNVST